jgi:hypothetical protein
MTAHQLEQLVRNWRRDFILREAFIVGAATLAGAAIAICWSSAAMVVAAAALAVFSLAFAVRLWVSPRWRIDARQFTRHLDRAFPELEESSTLLLRSPESLTLVERLQRERVAHATQKLERAASGRSFAAPRGLLRIPLWCLTTALVLFTGTLLWQVTRDKTEGLSTASVTAPEAATDTTAAPVAPEITHAELLITPPAYTGRPARRVAGMNAEVEEGAEIIWAVALDASTENARLVFGERDTLPLRQDGETLTSSRIALETALYHVAGEFHGGAAWNSRELYSLKVIKDQAPSLKIAEPTLPRTLVDSPRAVRIEVHVADDYGIADAHLVATVAKGTGEAVKFREQQIAFDAAEPAADAPNGRRYEKALDLAALGLEPGDELYFHVEARDNREPAINSARSETRFIVLRGPQQEVSAPGAGVAGVNLVPEYFAVSDRSSSIPRS